MDDIVPSHSITFGWQFTTCRSIHWFWLNIVQLPHLALSSSFYSSSMTCHKHLWNSWPCAPGLSAELYSWTDGWMQHDGSDSFIFTLHIDRFFYDWYDTTDPNVFVNFVSSLVVAFPRNQNRQDNIMFIDCQSTLFGVMNYRTPRMILAPAQMNHHVSQFSHCNQGTAGM